MDDDTPSPTVRTPIPQPAAPPEPPAPPAPEALAAPPVTPVEPVSPPPPAGPPPPAATTLAPPPPRQVDRGRTASIIFGFIILAVGLWFFADHTLGLELPTIRWSQFWPLILIAIGGWIVLGTVRRSGR